MSDSITTRELIDRLVRESGMKKKLATEILYAIPEVIEEGLIRDGEVRVKGLGTFRMKWTQGRTGRNPVTGEDIDIPAHYRLVFLPEQSLKEFINEENEMLGYKVIEEEEVGSHQPAVVSRQSSVVSRQSSVVSEEEENRSLQSEIIPDFPVRRRRIHWIIPVAVVVIAALSVVFYFRNFYQGEGKTEERSQKSEEIVQSSKFKVQNVDTVKTQTSEPQLITQNSELKLKTQDSRLKTIESGKHLFQLAREEYGNPFLWVLIYKENLDILSGPEQAIIGKSVKIPVLEGTPHKLTRNDSVNVADGYRLVYEYYLDKGDPKANDFKQAYQNYLPE